MRRSACAARRGRSSPATARAQDQIIFSDPGTKNEHRVAGTIETESPAAIVIKPAGGAAVILKIGEFKGEEVPVQKNGMEPVWVKKYQVERFLKKASELKK